MPANKERKVIDVQKAGETAADASSRPIIVGHKSGIQDPMVSEAAAKPTAKLSPTQGRRVVTPLETPSEAEPAAEAEASPPAAEPSSPKVPESAPTKSSEPEAAVVDAVASQVDAKRQATRAAEEVTKQQAAIEKLIAEKKYFVPTSHAAAKSTGVWLLLFCLLAALAGTYLAADAGLFKLPFELPLELIP